MTQTYHISVIIIIREHDARRAIDGLTDKRLVQIMLVPHGVLAVTVAREPSCQHLALTAQECTLGGFSAKVTGTFL